VKALADEYCFARRYYCCVNRKDLQLLSRVRLAEARALLRSGHPDGAYYLAGYAVECALKACIAKTTQRHEFPEKRSVDASHTHNLRDLVRVAKLELPHSKEGKQDPAFLGNWDFVQRWSETSRYGRHDLESARRLIEAIGDRRHGVMAWIKQYW
jgi:HEPN domain-containing protein